MLTRNSIMWKGYRSLTTTSRSEKSNANLNNLLKYFSGKKCFVGDFNFRNINWAIAHNEESKETQFIETIRAIAIFISTYWNQHKVEVLIIHRQLT